MTSKNIYPPIPPAKDVSFAGTIHLKIDARDISRGIFHIHETIPVVPGPSVLLYPEWLPGFHSPSASVDLLAGLLFKAGETVIKWRRDPAKIFAFHLDIPQGVATLEASFQYLSPLTESQGRVSVTPHLLTLQWNTVLLYPAGYFSENISVQAELMLPPGWNYACPIRAQSTARGLVFENTRLDTLVDSPVLAGKFFESVPLDERGDVTLNIAAEEAVTFSEDQLKAHRLLIEQCDLLFQGRPFDRYDFLVTLSDVATEMGVEHHRCCEVATSISYFSAWEKSMTVRSVFAHEFIHSWNGKYRRGVDSWTPSFYQPIGNSLMWVYEGLTQYLSEILSVRSGLWSVANGLDSLAITVARLQSRKGRCWRPLSDTTRDPIISPEDAQPWESWQRNKDYYQEGMMIWLEVDLIIRDVSEGEKSLDDFVSTFFRVSDCAPKTKTYDIREVVSGLESVASFDWRDYFEGRLHSLGLDVWGDVLGKGGYALAFRSRKTASQELEQARTRILDLSNSVGLQVDSTGNVTEVVWESPAFDARLIVGAKILAVNDTPFSLAGLEGGIGSTEVTGKVELIVKARGETFRRTIFFSGGNRFACLERLASSRPLINQIFSPIAENCRRSY